MVKNDLQEMQHPIAASRSGELSTVALRSGGGARHERALAKSVRAASDAVKTERRVSLHQPSGSSSAIQFTRRDQVLFPAAPDDQ